MADVLVIDDEPMLCEMLAGKVRRMGHSVVCVHTLAEGLERVLGGAFDVVFLDVRLPDGNGLTAVPTVRHAPSTPEVIIMTGAGDLDGAQLAIQSGAWNYIEKPSSMDEMVSPLIRALEYRTSIRSRNTAEGLSREGIIGSSGPLTACLSQAAQAARSEASVLLTGETGTGKELLACAIHDNSDRAGNNFVIVDCAAMTDTLVESTLFGYEKGAYTGADKPRDGLIRQADGGTLFLDEVGELPLAIQKSFLRVLQERRFRPLGSKQEIDSDFRVIAATNRDLDRMAAEGRFRSDLLFRLRTFSIDLPPLRIRPADTTDLAVSRLKLLCERYGIPAKELSTEFLESLTRYGWPGNVRELFNALERVLAVAREDTVLFSRHLPDDIRIALAQASLKGETVSEESPAPHEHDAALPPFNAFRESALRDIESAYLRRLMACAEDRIAEACRIAGLSRSRLYELLKKHGMTRP